jgi:hypothetical protein
MRSFFPYPYPHIIWEMFFIFSIYKIALGGTIIIIKITSTKIETEYLVKKSPYLGLESKINSTPS